jgi:hypothetical protein
MLKRFQKNVFKAMDGPKKDFMRSKIVNVLIRENKIAHAKINGCGYDSWKICVIMDYHCLVINFFSSNLFR